MTGYELHDALLTVQTDLSRQQEAMPLLVNGKPHSPTMTSPRELYRHRMVQKYRHLPRWFVLVMVTCVALTGLWMAILALMHTEAASKWLGVAIKPNSIAAESSSTLVLCAGVVNSLLGSFLSACGYCCQKWAHNRIKWNPSFGSVLHQRVFIVGLLLLAIGTISAVINLGILGQAVQAPFAALTLIYSALLGYFVLEEDFLMYDFLSSILIICGVAVDVYAAELANTVEQTYTLESLASLFFRDSLMPIGYLVASAAYVAFILRHVNSHNLQAKAFGLLAFSSCAGIIAGFTSLTVKSAVEVMKSTVMLSTTDIFSPFFLVIVAGIPACLVAQLFFLNKGLEYFGTLKFIPLYQAFIILGNMACGMVFYNEMANYNAALLALFLIGITTTLSGVCVQLAKVEYTSATRTATDEASYVMGSGVNNNYETNGAASVSREGRGAFPSLETPFGFDDIEFFDKDVKPLKDFDACKKAIVELLNSAQKSIYYSTFLCELNQVLVTTEDGQEHTFLSCVQRAIARGVKVHIIYNPITDYGLNDLPSLLPPEVKLSISVSNLGPCLFTKAFSNNSRYAFHHQKYLCIDEERLMVTGCDVNMERDGWLKANGLGYYWHELSVVCPCTPKVFDWIKKNHQRCTKKRHYDDYFEPAPFPLVSGGWREENVMVNMIMNAKHSVQIENQIFISGGSAQSNRISDALLTRVYQAHEANEDFHVLILTNAAQQDEPSYLTRCYCTISLQWSLEQLENGALARGMSLETLHKYLIVGRMEYDNVLIKVHSNVLITDGYYALRSSSNLADRSLSSRPCDTETGVLFCGPNVTAFQQELFNMYMGTKNQLYDMNQIFDNIAHHRGCILPMEKKPWSPIKTWFLMWFFIYGSEGATGGRKKVTYETTELKPQFAMAC